MKMRRCPMLDRDKTFPSMAGCSVPERQVLLTSLCRLTDSVCSHSGMWNESSFQLLYLFFVSSVDPFARYHFFQNFDFWITLSTLMYKGWAYCARGGALPQDHNKDLCSTRSTLQWKATCWNSRDCAIFYMCTVKKMERWTVWDISKARGCWNLDGRTHSFTSMPLKYKISIKSDRLEAKANNFIS